MLKYSIYYASSLIVLGFLFVVSLPALADMRSVPIAELILQAKNGNPEAQDELVLTCIINSYMIYHWAGGNNYAQRLSHSTVF